MNDNVTDLGEYKITLSRRTPMPGNDNCPHNSVEFDDVGEIIRCTKCKVQVSAYWFMKKTCLELNAKVKNLHALRVQFEEDRKKEVFLLAAKKVEKAWRSHTTIPTCPHCKCGILPQDGFGGSHVARAFEMRRREMEKK